MICCPAVSVFYSTILHNILYVHMKINHNNVKLKQNKTKQKINGIKIVEIFAIPII